jgi:phosphomannomutase
MVELLVREDRPLSELIGELPKYVVVKRKVPLPGERKASVMTRVEETLTATSDSVLTLDGVKAFYPEGWLLVRPSGTEPICRIFAESRTADVAARLADRGQQLVNEAVAAL